METPENRALTAFVREAEALTPESRFKDRCMELIVIPETETLDGHEKMLIVDPMDSYDPAEAFLRAELLDFADPNDAMLMEIINHSGFRRLWQIEQLTMPERFATCPDGANWPVAEHAIGCLTATRRFGGTIEQQLYALLHDYRKTAFGHLGECTIQGFGKENHHDLILLDGLQEDGLTDLVAFYGYDIDAIFRAEPGFVDRSRPAVDVDRFDYVTREGSRRTCPDKVDYIRRSVLVRENKIVFTNYQAAAEFGRDAIRHPVENWNSDQNALKEMLLYGILMRGLENGTLVVNDIETGTDEAVLQKLKLAGDDLTTIVLHMLEETFYYEHVTDITQLKQDMVPVLIPQFKPRYCDPEFLDRNGSLVRLSDVDEEFAGLLDIYKDWSSRERLLQFCPPALVPRSVCEELAQLTRVRHRDDRRKLSVNEDRPVSAQDHCRFIDQ